MRTTWVIVPSLLMLSACGDPLADIERVSDDTFAQEAVVATALPTEAELEREGSILSGLFRKRAEPAEIADPVVSPEDPVDAVVASLQQESRANAEASSENADVESAGGASVQGDVLAATAPVEAERKGGILSGLFRKRSQPEDVADLAQSPQTTEDTAPDAQASVRGANQANVAVAPAEGEIVTASTQGDTVLAEATTNPEGTLPEDEVLPSAATVATEEALAENAETTIASSVEVTPRRKGVFGWLRRAPAEEELGDAALPSYLSSAQDETSDTFDPSIQEEQVASLALEPVSVTPDPAAVEPEKRRRLFGRNTPAKAAGMAVPDVGLNANLPFGQVARVCDVAMKDLGTRVEQAEPKKTGYAIYDSAPDSAAPRSFYVTGFSDSCARQFTASLAVFGTPAFHEQLRYGLPAVEYPYSTTDRAYEKLKAKLCKVGPNKPCGARISRLEDTTAFVSVYEHFGANPRWADMLLHDGALLATAVKTP